MEILQDKDIKNLPVYGKSGSQIGRVVGFDLDPDSQAIISYHIKSQQVIKGIFEGNLLVSRDQVLEINKEKMIVDDTTEKASGKKIEIASTIS